MTTNDAPETSNNQAADDGAVKQRRNKRLFALGAVVAVAGAAAAGYWPLHASHFIATDNAYTAVEVAQITPAIAGTIAGVKARDTQLVKKGDVLIEIDPADARLLVVQAEAELDRAMRRVRSYVANDVNLTSQIAAREADQKRVAAQLAGAGADFERAQIDLKRREALAASGSVSGDELRGLLRGQRADALVAAKLHGLHRDRCRTGDRLDRRHGLPDRASGGRCGGQARPPHAGVHRRALDGPGDPGRTIANTDMGFWDVAMPLAVMGFALPLFFIPTTTIALGSAEEREMDSAAGLMNFLRTLAGAFATSMVTTVWSNQTTRNHAELVGLADRDGSVRGMLEQSGMPPEAAGQAIDYLITSQSGMLSTNQVMTGIAVMFILAAAIIWIAPKPGRVVEPGAGGH